MRDYAVIDGDSARFNLFFGNRTLLQEANCTIRGNGHATVNGKRVCITGDEGSVVVQNVSYVIPGYSPGKGILTIQSLQSNQQSNISSCSGRKLLLKGGRFVARLTPTQPAMSISTPATPEPNLSPTTGTGEFLCSQVLVISG